MARYNFKCRTMEDNKQERNYNRNQKWNWTGHTIRREYKVVERMALD